VFINGKMRPVKAVSEKGEGEIKMNDGRDVFNCNIS
jgi:hypothetical protein